MEERIGRLETYERPIEIKKYQVIGLILDLTIPFTFGLITITLSKNKKLNETIITIKRKNRRKVLKWKM